MIQPTSKISPIPQLKRETVAQHLRRLEAARVKRDRKRIQELTAEGRAHSVLSWPSVGIFDFRDLPEVPGIYVVSDGERALYVGQSNSIRRRWDDGHHVAIDAIAAGADRIHWQEVTPRMLNRVERAVWLAEQPPLNTAPPKGGAGVGLRP